MLTIDFNKLNIKSDDIILDIGCGEGRHIVKACQQKNTLCVGADFEFKNLLATKKKIQFHKTHNDFFCKTLLLVCMDITNLPFKDNSFDIIICSEVLEHIKNDTKAIEELIRILKPDKTIALSVPRFLPEKICWLLSKEYSNSEHVRIYKKKQIIIKIKNLGTRFLRSHHAHSFHSLYWWLKCFKGINNKDSKLISLYHKFLVWDIMKKIKIISLLDKLLNPFFGKSLVLYFRKKR